MRSLPHPVQRGGSRGEEILFVISYMYTNFWTYPPGSTTGTCSHSMQPSPRYLGVSRYFLLWVVLLVLRGRRSWWQRAVVWYSELHTHPTTTTSVAWSNSSHSDDWCQTDTRTSSTRIWTMWHASIMTAVITRLHFNQRRNIRVFLAFYCRGLDLDLGPTTLIIPDYELSGWMISKVVISK